MTARQRKIIDYLRRCHDLGLSPGLRAIGAHLGASREVARRELVALVEAGHLDVSRTAGPAAARYTIRSTDDGDA
jgi:DNA-binding IclR family transcriptional regulator